MSVVTIAEAWPAAGQPFTVTELDRIPDDGRRYELLDGALVVSPRPTTIHQFVAMRLLRALADACPEDGGQVQLVVHSSTIPRAPPSGPLFAA